MSSFLESSLCGIWYTGCFLEGSLHEGWLRGVWLHEGWLRGVCCVLEVRWALLSMWRSRDCGELFLAFARKFRPFPKDSSLLHGISSFSTGTRVPLSNVNGFLPHSYRADGRKNGFEGLGSQSYPLSCESTLWKMLKTFVSLVFHCGNMQVTWFVKTYSRSSLQASHQVQDSINSIHTLLIRHFVLTCRSTISFSVNELHRSLTETKPYRHSQWSSLRRLFASQSHSNINNGGRFSPMPIRTFRLTFRVFNIF